ncbi:MAG: DUF6297 family protein [Propionibacteriaceae bacterium]|nr:DUF6297 family protein [Propionibacteriaceae bacterium]
MNDARFGEIHEVDERQLQLLMKDWRRGRATRNIWQALSDAYIAVFAVVVVGAMLIGAVVQAQSTIATCETASCLAGRALLPWAALAGALAFALATSLMFGPVLASAAEGFWLMEAPIGRRRLLAKRLWLAIGAALVLGVGFGALVSALTGSDSGAVGAWALGTGFGAAGLVAVAAVEQTAERRWVLVSLQWVVGLSGLVALGVVVGTAAGWFYLPGLDLLGVELALGVGGFGLALGIAAGIVAYLRLDRIRRQRLTSGGSLLSGMQGAMFALDFALVRDILVERNARIRGHVRPTRGAGQGTRALILRDVQRLVRYPRPLLFWVASMAVPYAFASLGLQTINPLLSGVVLMAALIPFLTSLRVLCRTKGLARCLPYGNGALRQAAMTVPAALALVWGLAVMPAFTGFGQAEAADPFPGISSALLTAVAGLLAAVRWVAAQPANYSGPIVAVGVGAVPPGLMFSVLRGFDIVILVTLPLLIGWTPLVSLGVAVVAFSVLRSGFDQQALMDENEERKRQLELARAGASGGKPRQKIKVTRGA